MKRVPIDCRVARVLASAATMICLGLNTTAYAAPAEPDIPNIQANAERGSVQKEIELADAYFAGKGVVRDEKQAAYWYEKAANSGDPNAQLQIGFFYEAGIGVVRDSSRATAWFQRAAAGGSVQAKVNLGVAYIWGAGVRKDPVLGVQFLRAAAEQGSGPGAYYLADSYYLGVGVEKNLDQAKHWLEVAAKRHDPHGELGLALVLLQRPDHRDDDRAFRLLRDASKSGYVAAEHELGLRLARRPGFASRPEEALEFLRKASLEGFWKSTVVLAALYRDGKGVAKDPETAYVDFRVAALQGGEAAEKMVRADLLSLGSSLGSPRVKELDDRANDWVAHHGRGLEFAPFLNGGKQSSLALAYPENGAHAGRLFPLSESDAKPGEVFEP
ncbi:tetratricopeptide repeat protein [Occallatibacter savannae]|uniref:tetratricopeptide repeat protein n=1 Tax=Occallatibacter savannae TaxID=1002691 RepID=UPI000D696453|nr:tetratricopeptide repeat protein [Occallatibacter savannae]